MNFNAVPVLYYHSVKYKIRNNWVHPETTMTLKKFIRHIKLFRTMKVHTFFLDDVYFHISGQKKLPPNSLALTFDDGYTDNYIFVFPLLKKYGLKATFWIVPDFVDNGDTKIRPTLEDYWNNKISLDELNSFDGYINWEEMRLMEKSGLVDIQSHTLTHTEYPVSDKIIDFVNPDTKIDWLYWNLFRDDKPNFLTNPGHKIPLGYPVYEHQRGNTALKYEEDGTLTEALLEYVRNNGDGNFFEDDNWKEKLYSLSEAIKKRGTIYRKETDEEYISRVNAELSESKKIIERNLNKKVHHLCWPFGAWNERTEKLALGNGYLTTTIRGQKNIFNKVMNRRIDRIALDNPKYQNVLYYPYALYKLLSYKF